MHIFQIANSHEKSPLAPLREFCLECRAPASTPFFVLLPTDARYNVAGASASVSSLMVLDGLRPAGGHSDSDLATPMEADGEG